MKKYENTYKQEENIPVQFWVTWTLILTVFKIESKNSIIYKYAGNDSAFLLELPLNTYPPLPKDDSEVWNDEFDNQSCCNLKITIKRKMLCNRVYVKGFLLKKSVL